MTSLYVTNLTGVHYLKWDFSAAQQNGGVGYTELAAYGAPTALTPPSFASPVLAGGANFTFSVSGLTPGRNYALQSTTNIVSPVWTTETNFVPLQSIATFTNSTTAAPQKFYRVAGQ